MEVFDIARFQHEWRTSHPGDIAHIKGFGKDMSDCYNATALWELWTCSAIAWDGSPPESTGFTALVSAFLHEKQERKAIAFVKQDGVEAVQAKWQKEAAEFSGRIIVVTVDVEADVERFGVAMQATGSKQVFALGGEGSLGQEAEASFADGVKWTVYALSRGSKEQSPSLMDWAARTHNDRLSFVYWKDPRYEESFHGEAPHACPMEDVTLEEFLRRQSENPDNIAHIKGFSKGMTCGAACEQALQRLSSYSALAWDGDPPESTGFTALVSGFLSGQPERKAIAFCKQDGVEKFQANWQKEAADFSGRILIVKISVETGVDRFGLKAELSRVDGFPRWAQELYLLGRVAIKATGSKQVISLGGGAITGHEAEASLGDGVKWTVYALSRGIKEQHPSLMDWAAKCSSLNLHFEWRLDPNCADAFAVEAPASKNAADAAASAAPSAQDVADAAALVQEVCGRCLAAFAEPIRKGTWRTLFLPEFIKEQRVLFATEDASKYVVDRSKIGAGAVAKLVYRNSADINDKSRSKVASGTVVEGVLRNGWLEVTVLEEDALAATGQKPDEDPVAAPAREANKQASVPAAKTKNTFWQKVADKRLAAAAKDKTDEDMIAEIKRKGDERLQTADEEAAAAIQRKAKEDIATSAKLKAAEADVSSAKWKADAEAVAGAKGKLGDARTVTTKSSSSAASASRQLDAGSQNLGRKTALEWTEDQEQFAHLPALPEGWIRVQSTSTEQIYFFNLETGRTTFTEPTDLPIGWVKATSRSTGRTYYWNARLKQSQFERPEGETG